MPLFPQAQGLHVPQGSVSQLVYNRNQNLGLHGPLTMLKDLNSLFSGNQRKAPSVS